MWRNNIMADGRIASSPTSGAFRDAIRTFVAFIVAFALTKLLGEATAVNLAGAQEAVVVIITSAIFAFIGKSMRNSGLAIGKVM
jgi:uncharacterized membrane protein YccC